MNTSDFTIKQCSICGIDYPLTSEYFYRDKNTPSGFRSHCKTCKRAIDRKYQETHKDQLEEYYKNNATKRREYSRNWRINNPEKVTAYENTRRMERKKNPREVQSDTERMEKRRIYDKSRNRKEWRRELYQKNIERERKRSREWSANNREKARESNRKWMLANPDKVAANVHRRRARRLGAEGRYTYLEIRDLHKRQNGKCFHCQMTLERYHIDHWIPLSKGGSNWISNIRLLCPTCNLSKGAKLPCEWDNRYCNC